MKTNTELTYLEDIKNVTSSIVQALDLNEAQLTRGGVERERLRKSCTTHPPLYKFFGSDFFNSPHTEKVFLAVGYAVEGL